jgi:hypothetical protein
MSTLAHMLIRLPVAIVSATLISARSAQAATAGRASLASDDVDHRLGSRTGGHCSSTPTAAVLTSTPS